MLHTFKISILCLIMIFSLNGFTQDIHFSQFFETPLLRNPALAGIFNGDFRAQGVYRTQWNSVTVPYQTASLNAEYKLHIGRSNDFLTLGGEVLYDKAGSLALTTTHFLPVLNYHKSLNDQRNMYLSIGFMGGIVQRRLDRSKITTNNQYNGAGYDAGLANGETFTNNGYTYFDAATGLSFNTQIGNNIDNNLFVGAAYHHFNKSSKVSFYGNDKIEMIPKWVFSAGVRMSVTEYSYITFQGDYSHQGPYTETIGGALYSLKLDDPLEPQYIFHVGGFLRWKDAIIPVAKIEYKPFTLALSYDINVSPLKSASYGRGGMEMSISYQAFFNKNSSKDDILCPRF